MVDKRRVIVTLAVLFSWLCNTSDASSDGLSYGDGMMVFLGGDGETDGVIVSVGGRTGQESNISSKRLIYGTSASCTVDEDFCVLENINCTYDDDCKSAFPNLEQALELGRSSPVPHPPICKHPRSDQGYCTCGRSRCVSTSKQFGRGTLLYYCGPCGHVGSQCNNGTCLHEMAVCRDSYCQCKDDGVFYEFSYCEIPYRGYEMALQMAIIICIVIAVCLITASIYGMILKRSLQRLSRSLRRQDRQEETRESPPDDTPPTYEDVVDTLPTYQDALQMANEGSPEGIPNPAFDGDILSYPSYQPGQEEEEDIHTLTTEASISYHNQHIEEETNYADSSEGTTGDDQATGVHQSPARPRFSLQPIEAPLHETLELQASS